MTAPFSQPLGLKFRGKGYEFPAAPNAETQYFIDIDDCYLLNGGEFHSTNGEGDQITVEVVDRTGVIGQGENFSLDKFIDGWFLSSRGFTRVDLSYYARICAPLSIRVTYKNSTAQEKLCRINFYKHKSPTVFTLQQLLGG